MKKKILGYFVLLCVLLSACNNDKSAKKEYLLERDTLITELSDSSLIYKNIPFIGCDSGEIFFSDYKNGCIVVLNQDLSFKYKTGKQGVGPEELIGALVAYKDGVNYFILDDGNRAIKTYSKNGQYLKTTNMPQDMAWAVWNRFVYKDSLLYLPCMRDTILAVVNMKGEVVKKIGRCADEEFGGRILLSDGLSIWTIGQMAPIIERYSYDGSLLLQKEYGDIPFVREWSENLKKEKKILVKDACIDGGYLYILLTGKVLRFFLNKGIPELDSNYSLPHGFYGPFVVSNHKMYCFNVREVSIERFTLKD